MVEPDLDRLFAFAEVAEAASFTRAAAARGVSQSAMSLKVRLLERDLGVRLFERVGRRVSPTAAGRELLRHVAGLRAAHAAAIAAVTPHRDGAAGRVVIGTGATACLHFLPGPLRRLRASMPGLEIIVRTGDSRDILAGLEANTIDVALVTLPAAGRALMVEELMGDAMSAVLPAAERPPEGAIDAATLARHPLILYESRGQTRRIIDDWFAAAGIVAKPVMELSSVETIRELVGAGLGAAILPELALGAEVTGQVAVRRLAPGLERRLGLVLRRDKPLDPALRAVVAAMRAQAAARG
jgi:DNA-binding transcriptional LysR family regulator